MMPCTRICVDPTVAPMTQERKKKEAFRTSKTVMREHEGAQFIPYHYNIKG